MRLWPVRRVRPAKVDPFVKTEYIFQTMPDYDSAYTVGPYYAVVPEVKTHVTVEVQQVPPGEMDVRRGMHVEATDGTVGYVDEFLVDTSTGNITHMVLREGHLFDQKNVSIPISDIDSASEDTVNLKLNKREIAALPSIAIRRPGAL